VRCVGDLTHTKLELVPRGATVRPLTLGMPLLWICAKHPLEVVPLAQYVAIVRQPRLNTSEWSNELLYGKVLPSAPDRARRHAPTISNAAGP
jgi:hypothetical protein